VAEKDPKKKIVKKSAVKKAADKKEEIKEPKKAAKASFKKAGAAPAAEPKKKTEKAEKEQKKDILTGHKMEASHDESNIEAAKFYPVQMKEKNGIKHEEYKKPGERSEQDIPGRYYDNKIVLMARDPFWCYAYWDISGGLMQSKADEARHSGDYKLILRVYDVTDIRFDGKNAHKYMDIEVTGDANNWYINVWEAGRTYIADLGFRTTDGKFILIARSNAVGVPSDRVSDKMDEEWMVMDEDFDELFRLSGGGKFGASEHGRGVGLMENMLSSESVSSFSSPVYKPAPKGFFLWADTELILYGGTEKNAKLTVKGETIKLKDDGSFSLRFHLPDGLMELPVEATSADGLDKKSVKINVQRKTE
jgi:uncharacterized protein